MWFDCIPSMNGKKYSWVCWSCCHCIPNVFLFVFLFHSIIKANCLLSKAYALQMISTDLWQGNTGIKNKKNNTILSFLMPMNNISRNGEVGKGTKKIDYPLEKCMCILTRWTTSTIVNLHYVNSNPDL